MKAEVTVCDAKTCKKLALATPCRLCEGDFCADHMPGGILVQLCMRSIERPPADIDTKIATICGRCSSQAMGVVAGVRDLLDATMAQALLQIRAAISAKYLSIQPLKDDED